MFRRTIINTLITAFFLSSLGPMPQAQAMILPEPGMRVALSQTYKPLVLKGIQVDEKTPFQFEFLVDKGDSTYEQAKLKDEIQQLTKYFLTCLTVPEEDLWVNLSPYEHNRIAPEGFGQTIMGKELLEQDYLLKQIVASLSYPEEELGQKFWQKVYQQAYERFGTTQIPVNTFNKVWIVPKSADVYVSGKNAFVVNSDLDVMMEADYTAIKANLSKTQSIKPEKQAAIYNQVMRELILPQLRKEVNTGKNFAGVRQVYMAMILATWYKRHLRESILGLTYIDQNKVKGIDIEDKDAKEKIYQRYIQSFKKSVYNYVREELDPSTGTKIPRKYVSGGFDFAMVANIYQEVQSPKGMSMGPDLTMAAIKVRSPEQEIRFIPRSMRRGLAKARLITMLSVAGISATNTSLEAATKLDFKGLIKDVYGSKATNSVPYLVTTIPEQVPQEKKEKTLNAQASSINSTVPSEESKKTSLEETKTTGTERILDGIGKYKGSIGAVLAAAVAGIGLGFLMGKKNKTKKTIPQRSLPRRQPAKIIIGAMKAQVNNDVPQVPTADPAEKQLNQTLLERMKSYIGNKKPVKHYHIKNQTRSWGWVDGLGAISGLGIAALDPNLAGIAMGVSSTLTTRPMYFTKVWLHEVIGHALPATLLHPSQWHQTLSKRNLMGNWKLSQWLGSMLPWKKAPAKDPEVQIKSQGMRDKIISRSGFYFSVFEGLASLGLASWFSLDHEWIRPLLGPLFVSTFAVIKGSWLTDRKKAQDGRRPCGILGIGRWGTVSELAAEGDEKSYQTLERRLRRISLRGKHSAGILVIRKGDDGKIRVYNNKDMITKHGLGRDLEGNLIKKSKNEVKPFSSNVNSPEIVLDMKIAHTRWGTGGEITIDASHPHIGPVVMMPTWSYNFQGDLVESNDPLTVAAQEIDSNDFEADVGDAHVILSGDNSDVNKNGNTVTAGAAHNGDNNKYKFKDRLSENVPEIRETFTKILNLEGELPPGDSPPIPLQILYHLTQGNWFYSARFAHTEVHHNTFNEIKDDVLTREEVGQIGSFFHTRFKKFAGLLCRPGLNREDKTLKDAWVTKEMADKDPSLLEQYNLIQGFKKYLLTEMEEAVQNGNLPAKISDHWEGRNGKVVMENFVNMTVERFFIGDRATATHEFQMRAEGTYGLIVYTTTDTNGFTLVARKQGVVFGYDLERRELVFASDTYTAQEKDADNKQMQTLFYLNPAGRGEMLDVQILRQSGDMVMTPFSFERNGILSPDEISTRRQELTPDNGRYYRDLPLPTTITQDVNDIAKGIAEDQKTFMNPESSNYQSAEEMTKRLASLWIEKRLLSQSSYQAIHKHVRDAVRKVSQECQSLNCTDGQKSFLLEEGMAQSEKESALMRLVRYRILGRIKLLTESILSGDITDKSTLDEQFENIIGIEERHILSFISVGNLQQLYDLWSKEKTEPVPENTDGEKVEFWIGGYEKGEMIAKVIKQLTQSLMPRLKVKAGNTNEILDYEHEHLNLHATRLAMIFGDFGSNFPDLEAANIISKAIGLENVFGLASRMDSTLSIVLGQGLSKNAPFTRRIFVAGELRQNEVSSYSEAVQMACAINIILHVVRRLRILFPDEKPFGLSLSELDMKALDEYQVGMVEDAKRVTGYDGNGNPSKSKIDQLDEKTNKLVRRDVHETIDEKAKFLSKRFLEVPVVNAVFWSYVVGFFTVTGGKGLLGWSFSGWLGSLFGGVDHLIQWAAGSYWSNIATLLGLTGGEGILTTVIKSLSGRPMIAAEGILTLLLGGYIIPRIFQLATGWTQWIRTGPPPNISSISEEGFWEMQRLFIGKLFTRASKGMGSQPHGAHYKRAISELAHLMVRGSLISVTIPTDPRALDEAKSATMQLKVTKSSPLGIFKQFPIKFLRKSFKIFKKFLSGGISVTMGREEIDDPAHNVSDMHINIGGQDRIPPKIDPEKPMEGQLSPVVREVWKKVFHPFGGHLAHKVLWNLVVSHSSKFDGYGDSIPTAAAATTQTPTPSPDKEPLKARRVKDVEQSQMVDAAKPSGEKDSAQLALDHRRGGIDMDSRLMAYHEQNNRVAGLMSNDNSKVSVISVEAPAGYVPEVMSLTDVTPGMLKAMLGGINFN